MKLHVQSTLSPQGTTADRLVIHRRSEVVRNRALVVLIHGLGGKRYATWGAMPEMLYEDLGRVDLGFYAYPTALRRVRLWRSIPLKREARLLADKLRVLREYERMVLIGHSMGGLLARGAAAHLATSGQKKVQRRLAGLVTVASPLLGSGRVPLVGALFSRDLGVLYPHNEYLVEVAEAMATHYNIKADLKPTLARNLPQWAIRASDDVWVDTMSSAIGFPASQLLDAEGSHTDVAKPKTRTTEVYRFIVGAIERAAGVRPTPFVDTPLFEARAAGLDDLEAIGRISDTVFEEDEQGTEEQAEALLNVYPDLYRLICEEDGGDVLGYFGIIPLTEDATQRLLRGELTVPQMTPEDLAPDPRDREAVYVGGVAGVDSYSKGWALNELRSALYSLAATRRLRVLTRPVTPDGLRVTERRGFAPVEEGETGIGCLYQRWIERDGDEE